MALHWFYIDYFGNYDLLQQQKGNKMITATQCQKKYGDPKLLKTQQKHFLLWVVPQDIRDAFSHVRFSAIDRKGFPHKIFCNKDLQPKLEQALKNVIERGLTKEIYSWDGCFMIRKKTGGKTLSVHSWAIAIDINRSGNDYGHKPTMSSMLVACFVDAGLDWGGYWKTPDGMHFQLNSI